MSKIDTIGKSALLAANYAISVTGHNIANATVEGYNRQVVLQSNVSGQNMGFGFIGHGTQIDDVRRVYDEFLGRQAVQAQASKSQLDAYYNQISKINQKLSDNTAGISPALQSFFSALQEVADEPTSLAVREALLSETSVFNGRFNEFAAQLTEIRNGVNYEITHSVDLINTYAKEIANLNNEIARAQIATSDPAPNDLLDQRDLAISKLSELIGVRTVKNGINGLDVYVGNGQPLVINNTSFNMFARQSTSDPSKVEIGYMNNGIAVVIPDKLLSGGAVKGLLEFRDQTLNNVENEIGRIVVSLALDFNAQHKLGMDLNGDMGTDFFNVPLSATSYTSASPPGSVTSTIDINNYSKLVASDYRIEVAGNGDYKMTRLSDGKSLTVLAADTSAKFPPAGQVWDDGSLYDDGIQFESLGLVPGNVLVSRPLANAAAGLSTLITDANKIAAASPVRTATGPNTSGTGNLGTGVISAGAVTGTGFATSGTLTFSETPAPPAFVASADVWVTPPSGPSTLITAGTRIPYTENTTFDFGSYPFTITGKPKTGDTFSIEPNTGGLG
ncbi:MAG: flagellar hook-associated protein FlgK, partial [Burkholderiaceae bacterium]|nr:flagellar hook-associated protein FlgK [Burkholderiaceae bacterium]